MHPPADVDRETADRRVTGRPSRRSGIGCIQIGACSGRRGERARRAAAPDVEERIVMLTRRAAPGAR